MKSRIILFVVNFITEGNRPIRIFLFGGLLFAAGIMVVISKLSGIDIDIGSDINKDLTLANAILLIASFLLGYGISYSIVHIAAAIKSRLE